MDVGKRSGMELTFASTSLRMLVFTSERINGLMLSKRKMPTLLIILCKQRKKKAIRHVIVGIKMSNKKYWYENIDYYSTEKKYVAPGKSHLFDIDPQLRWTTKPDHIQPRLN